MSQTLRLKSEFEKLLETYAPSDQSIQILKKAKIVLFDGPSGSGRNTIMSKLVETGKYQILISDTTRRPRVNNGVPEQDGVEYWFLSEEAFLDGLKKGAYVEAAVIHGQQVSGVSIKEIERVASVDKIALNDIQPDGVDNFRKYKSDVIPLFVIPPSFSVWLERLKARGEMSDEEWQRRIESSIEEIKHALAADYYYFIINDNLEEAVKIANEICSGVSPSTDTGRAVAESLLKDIQEYLTHRN